MEPGATGRVAEIPLPPPTPAAKMSETNESSSIEQNNGGFNSATPVLNHHLKSTHINVGAAKEQGVEVPKGSPTEVIENDQSSNSSMSPEDTVSSQRKSSNSFASSDDNEMETDEGEEQDQSPVDKKQNNGESVFNLNGETKSITPPSQNPYVASSGEPAKPADHDVEDSSNVGDGLKTPSGQRPLANSSSEPDDLSNGEYESDFEKKESSDFENGESSGDESRDESSDDDDQMNGEEKVNRKRERKEKSGRAEMYDSLDENSDMETVPNPKRSKRTIDDDETEEPEDVTGELGEMVVVQKKKRNYKRGRTKYTQISRGTKKKTAKQKPMTEETKEEIGRVCKLSAKWVTICWLLSVHKMENLIPLPEKPRKILEKKMEEYQETNSHICDIPLAIQMRGIDNYRGVMKKVEKMLLSPKVVDPNFKDRYTTKTLRGKLGPMDINYTGPVYLDPSTATADEIIAAAKQRRLNGINHVFGPADPSVKYIVDGDSSVIDNELLMFKCHQHKLVPGYLPVARYHVSDFEESTMEQLRNRLLTTSMCLITGLADVCGFKKELFDPNVLLKNPSNETLEHPIRKQVPQSTATNFGLDDPNEKKWKTSSISKDKIILLRKFVENLNQCVKLAKDARTEIGKRPDDFDAIVKKLEEELHKIQIRVGKENNEYSAIIIAFATNISLKADNYELKDQTTNINLFPYFLSPGGTGNLLNFIEEIIAGLNGAQLYVKPPGSRTTIHPENSALASFNHNIGPSECVWYGVTLEQSKKLMKLLEKYSKIDGKPGNGHYDVGSWPIEEICIKEGIILQKFVQKPGETVYVGHGTFHWVQSNGYTINVSWNIAQPTFEQLALASLMNDHYLANNAHILLPMEKMCWEIAAKQDRHDPKFEALISSNTMRSMAKCQTEFDCLEEQGIELHPVEEAKDAKSVERCMNHACNNKPTFNIFFLSPDNKTYCVKCTLKMKKKSPQMKAYYRQFMDYYKKIFDAYNEFRRANGLV